MVQILGNVYTMFVQVINSTAAATISVCEPETLKKEAIRACNIAKKIEPFSVQNSLNTFPNTLF